MKLFYKAILLLLIPQFIYAQPETEPNNSFVDANLATMGALVTGTVNDLTVNSVKIDQYDYFKAVLPANGTLRIYITGTNTHSNNGYFYVSVYDSRMASGQLVAKYVGNVFSVAPGNSISDSIILYGRASETIYFRLETSSVFNYTLRYTMQDFSTNDVEPNNTFAQSITMVKLQEKQGNIGYVKAGVNDADDYYRAEFPQDGTLKIMVQGKNRSGSNGYLYMYGYDSRQASGPILSKYISNSGSIKADSTIYDTMYFYGRAADTFYFRLVSSGAFSYSLKYDVLDTTVRDMEPNNSFDEALPIAKLENKIGNIGYVKTGTTDANDYYRAVLPADGTLKIFVEGKNHNGGNGWMYIYGYDSRKASGQIFGKYVSNSASIPHLTTIYDSIILHGKAADTFYFRLSSSDAFNYKISYDYMDTSLNDLEPNNTFEESISMIQLQEKIGHIGYEKNGTKDANDYYKTVIPIDGTLKVYIEAKNRMSSNGWVYLYGYDRRKASGQIFGTYVSGSANINKDSTIYDTLTIYGILADTFYFRITSSGAFTYKISYNTTVNSLFDPEPNNTFAESKNVRQGLEQNGQIGYTLGGITDLDDYYNSVFPTDGTLKFVVQGKNNGGSNGYMYVYGYDSRKASGQIFGKYVSGSASIKPDSTIYDTIYIYGLASDTFYYRITSSGPFSYNFSYDNIDPSNLNDVEPNETYEQAILMTELEEKKGHIGYVRTGTADATDFYKFIMPADGALKIMVQGKNRWNANGYMYMYGYDSRKASGQIFGNYVSGSANIKADSTIYDTLYLYGRSADTFYMNIQSSGAFTYSLKYLVFDTSTNNIEPNETYTEALPIAHKEVKSGSIGYVKKGSTDTNDYYVTSLPTNGTLKVMIQARNRWSTNGYMYMYGNDSRKASGQVFGKYISGNSNIKKDSTIYDTIYVNCRTADTFYFRMTSSGAFTYSFSYQMVDTSIADPEPNNTFDTHIPLPMDSLRIGNIGYVKYGVDDNEDYYRTLIPAKGNVKIIVNAKNTGTGNGYLYMYVYDKRKASGLVFQKYVSNSSSISAGTTIKDTINVNCFTSDTIYIRFSSSSCFSYGVNVQLQNLQPVADFSYTRVGNTFGYSKNPKSNGTSFLWDLGNGTTTSLSVPPLTTYVPGFYTPKLIARNNLGGCFFTDTAMQSFTIEGIEKYTPLVGGPGNILFTIYGGGLDTNIVIKLTQGTKVYRDSVRNVNQNGNIYNCLVDLHNAPLGFYNVEIIKSGVSYNYPNGFKVEALRDKLRVDFVGPASVRSNTDNFYSIRIHNEGNTFTGISKAFLLTPSNIAVTDLDSLLPVPPTPYVNPDTLLHALPVTIADGFPINGEIRGYYLSGIPAGGFKDIRFLFNTPAGLSDIYVWSSGPISGSPYRPWSEDCWKAKANLAYQTINYPLDLIPIVDCGWNLVKLGVSSLNFLATAAGGLFSNKWDVGAAYVSYGKTGQKAAINCSGEAGLATGPGAIPMQVAETGYDITVNTLSTQQAYYDWQEKCNDEPKDKNKNKIDSRASRDPNEKTGPSGIGGLKYINGKNRLMTYGIFFENLAAATLPAQNVFLYDTLNKYVYNLATLKVESFGIGKNTYYFSAEQNQYVAEVNINATLAVRVNLKLDTATGVLRTSFITLDRATGDTTTNQLEGFLPPNVTAPEGQGYITYSLYMKEGMADGTQIDNKASIIFDNNPAIITNTWLNTLDNLAPTSSVTNVTGLTDTTAQITISGNDATSGVEYYVLYTSENGGPYQKIGHVRSSVTFFGRRGGNYHFYVRAVDSVGNVEAKTPTSEGSITFSGVFVIHLGEITATNMGNRNRLDWNTLYEDAGDYFEVERSENGNEFSKMATLKANGKASSYSIYDSHPQTGRTWYRLKMFNVNGKYSYSKVVSAYKTKAGEFVLEAFPNPVREKINVRVLGERSGKSTIQISNMTGIVLGTMDVLQNNMEIDMRGYAPGIYLLRYSDAARTEIIRVVKN